MASENRRAGSASPHCCSSASPTGTARIVVRTVQLLRFNPKALEARRGVARTGFWLSLFRFQGTTGTHQRRWCRMPRSRGSTREPGTAHGRACGTACQRGSRQKLDIRSTGVQVTVQVTGHLSEVLGAGLPFETFGSPGTHHRHSSSAARRIPTRPDVAGRSRSSHPVVEQDEARCRRRRGPRRRRTHRSRDPGRAEPGRKAGRGRPSEPLGRPSSIRCRPEGREP